MTHEPMSDDAFPHSSADPVRSARKRRRFQLRRLLIRASLALVLLLAATVAAVVLLREAIARIVITRVVGPAVGLKVDVGDISISLRGDVAIRGLLARSAEDGSKVREARFQLLEARVSPVGMIRSGIGGIRSIKVYGVVLEVDLDRPGKPGDPPHEKEGAWPESLPNVEIDLERALILSGGRETSIEALRIVKSAERSAISARRIASGPAALSFELDGTIEPGPPPLRGPRAELAVRKLDIDLDGERWAIDSAPVLRLDLGRDRLLLDPPLVLANGEGRIVVSLAEEEAGGTREPSGLAMFLLRLELHLPGSHAFPGYRRLSASGIEAKAVARLSSGPLAPGAAPRSIEVHAAVREVEATEGLAAGKLSGFRLDLTLDRPEKGESSARASLDIPRIEVSALQGKPLERPLSGAFTFEASAGGTTLRLERLRANLGPLLLEANAAAVLAQTLDAVLAGGQRPVADIDGRVRLVIDDLARARDIVPGIRRAEGRVVLEASARGSASSPRVEASLILEGIAVRHESFPAISDLGGRITVREGSLAIERFEGEVGGALLRMSGGATGIPAAPRMKIRLDGDDVLLVRTDRARLRADLHVEAEGEISSLLVSGRVRATSGRVLHEVPLLGFLRTVTRKVGGLAPGRGPASGSAALRASGFEIFRFEEPPLRGLRFAVEVTAAEAIELRGNVVRGGIRPDVKLLGSGEFPYLAGAIYVDDLVLTLPATKLRIDSGSVRFDERNHLVPELNLIGETRMRGYDITAAVSGPANDPQIVFSSTPPLPADDLVLLVTTGRPPAGGGADSEGKAVLAVARYFGEDLIRKLFSEEDVEAKESILDRFEVDTGRNVSRSGRDTWEARFRLRREVLVEKDALYLTGEQDEFDHYNMGLRIVFRGS